MDRFHMRNAWPILVAALAGCLSPGDPASPDGLPGTEDPDPGPASALSNFTWRSGPYEGDFAIGFTLLPTEDAECEFFAAAQGVSDGRPPTMMFLVEGGVDHETHSLGRGQGGLVFDANAHVQAVGGVEHRVPGEPFPWADTTRDTFTLLANESTNVTFAAVGVTPTGPGWAAEELNGTSALFSALCTPSVPILETYSGDQVHIFNEASFRGGASAHAMAALEDSGLTLAGHIGLDVQAPHGVLLLSVSGDILLNHVGAGSIEVTYPGGSELIVDRPSELLVEYAVLGNPFGIQPHHVYRSSAGSYEVDATYASVDLMGTLQGAIVGLDPVAELSPLVNA